MVPHYIEGSLPQSSGDIQVVRREWNFSDRVGSFRCRISPFRMRYRVSPGLYAVGKPDRDSPVLVTANYKLSFDHLRRNLDGINAYVLVLDTGGINVWCAAGKGTFGTDELINRIEQADLIHLVDHRTVIVPQLGASGVRAHVVQRTTGFRVRYGPVYAKDIPLYFENNFTANGKMRTVRFGLLDRLILTPMELFQAWKPFLIYSVAMLVFFGLLPSGIIFHYAVRDGLPFVLLGAVALLAGSFFTPLLLPLIPFRAFSLKGYVIGLVAVALVYLYSGFYINDGAFCTAFIFIFFPFLSSYAALNFTGATPYTSISGVKKELKIMLPFYLSAAGISLVLLVLYKLQQWEIL
jgi:hypothetical protein